MDGSDFFILGGILVAAALILSAIGIRGSESFPGSRPLLIGVTALFAAIVAATGALAVVNAREEQEHREEELAHEEDAAGEEVAGEEGAGAGEQGALAEATALELTSPEDGSLSFEPDSLEAPAGPLTITYANPSQVPHNVAVEAADGELLGETPTFTAGEEGLELEDLAPGQYVFFCTVPGHRQAGMEGDLEVR